MKKFDLSQFKTQLNLSRKADFVINRFNSFDKLVKFALQHCESEDDYDNLWQELDYVNFLLEKYIKIHICDEHSENNESTTCTTESN